MSGGKISFNASGLSFDIKTFNDYSGFKGLDNYGFNTTNYEEPDYSNTLTVEVKEQVLDKVELEVEENKEPEKLNANKHYKGAYSGVSKFVSTTLNVIKNGGNEKFGWIGYGGESTIIFLGMICGGEPVGKALWKSVQTEIKQVSKKLATDKLVNQGTNINFLKDFKSNWVVPDDWGFKQKFGSLVTSGFAKGGFLRTVTKQFGGVFSLNVGFNVLFDVIDGGDFKFGTDIYKGGVMCVFGTAGKLLGKVYGGKITEATFNMIGAYVAEVTVKWYDTEIARGIAGVAIVLGGAAGLVIGLAAGWALGVVALAVIGVAAVAGFVVWAIEKLVQVDWGAVGSTIMDFGADVAETINETVEVVVDTVVDFVENVGATISNGWNTLCAWFA